MHMHIICMPVWHSEVLYKPQVRLFHSTVGNVLKVAYFAIFEMSWYTLHLNQNIILPSIGDLAVRILNQLFLHLVTSLPRFVSNNG